MKVHTKFLAASMAFLEPINLLHDKEEDHRCSHSSERESGVNMGDDRDNITFHVIEELL